MPKSTTRRNFLKSSLAGGLAFALPGVAPGNGPRPTIAPGEEEWGPGVAAGPNGDIRMAVIGLGGIATPGGVGGRGRQLIAKLRTLPGVRIAALCEVDQEVLDHELQPFKDRHETVATYRDIRKLLDDKTIDAVAVSTPNHWHALATIWACRAGKDVYVEKPFSYNIWEGRQMVAAARKFGRIVQVGTQSRSSEVLRQAIDQLRSGRLGPIRCVHALVYRAREGIGKVSGPTPVPPTVDYDLWCGPAPKAPPLRKQLHYEWHWFWATGNGEIGNNGAHVIDVGRWALGQDKPPARVVSIGGRLGFDDAGETPNTQIAIWDYQPAPLICEVRNVRKGKTAAAMGKFRNADRGVVIECEGGYFSGDASSGAMFDIEGRKIEDMLGGRKPPDPEAAHLANFLAAVRSRNSGDLHAEALQGHVSASCSHLANISHRLGKQTPVAAMLEANRSRHDLVDAVERCRDYLRNNGIDLAATPAGTVGRLALGPWLDFDPQSERFTGEFAEQANQLSRRAYREPFTVPEIS